METTPENQMMIYPITENGLDFLHIKNIPDSLLDGVRKDFEVAKTFMYFDDMKGGAAYDEDIGEYKRTGGAVLGHTIFHPDFIEHTGSVQYTVNMREIVLSNLSVPPPSHMNYFRYPEQMVMNYASYRNGEEYKAHWDQGTVSMITWLSDHNEFTGGEIVFPEFDNYTITPEKNSAIIFPSHYQHGVNKVVTESEEPVRHTFTVFFHTMNPRVAIRYLSGSR